MGLNPSIPLMVRQPEQSEGPLDTFGKAMQIKSMMSLEQHRQAELQQKNLQNQGLAMQLKGEQALRSAESDPDWDPRDLDKSLQVMRNHGVPLDTAQKAIAAIGGLRESFSKASTENLNALEHAHSFFDDALQSLKDTPADQKQNAYNDAIARAKQYATNLPEGQARQQFLGSLAQLPVLYNQQFINSQHAALRTQQYLLDEAKKNAETREAEAKAFQAQNEGNLFASRVPGAQAESSIQQQSAGMTPEQRALAGNLFYQAAGGDKQSRGALNLETQQKIAAAQAANANAPAALQGVAPHLVVPASAAYNKAALDFAKAHESAQNMSDFIQQAKSGNKEAVRIVPLQGALEITTAQGVHRINRTEVDQYGSAGSLYDKLAGKLGGAISGKNITDSVLDDMDALQKTVSANAAKLHANEVKGINTTYGSKFQPMNFDSEQNSGGHVIAIGDKYYRYKGSGDTADMKNYAETTKP